MKIGSMVRWGATRARVVSVDVEQGIAVVQTINDPGSQSPYPDVVHLCFVSIHELLEVGEHNGIDLTPARACPYCGTQESDQPGKYCKGCVVVDQGRGGQELGWQGSTAPIFWVTCRNCGARGPIKRSAQLAVGSWNTLTNANDSQVPWPADSHDKEYKGS